MRKYTMNVAACCIALTLIFNAGNAQDDTWVSYSKKMSAKGLEGRNFRLTAMVKAELSDDSASAHLWMRISKEKGRGFFENMDKRPIRDAAWKQYTIQGKVDSGATDLVFGLYCMFNGKFYFDDIKLEIETGKNKWKNVYSANFEDGTKDSLEQGIFIEQYGVNAKYAASIASMGSNGANGKSFLIEGNNVPNFGANSKIGKFASVNGIKLYYEIYGSGAPLLVLHGNGGSIASAAEFYPGLMKQYKVIAIDSRAQGNSTSTGAPLNYDIMASDINELLNQLNIDSCFIWGQSDGAILSLLLAKDYPKKVKRALAFSPNIQPDSLAVFQWAIDYDRKEATENKDANARALNQMMLDFPNFPYSELSKIQAPVLMMSGDRDVIRPEHILKMYQHIPNSQLCILPGTTHGGAWEKKELFLTIMNDFFNKPFTMPDTKSWMVQ